MKSRNLPMQLLCAGLGVFVLCNPTALAQGRGTICIVPGGFDEVSKGGATVEAYEARQREPEPGNKPESVRFVRVDRFPPAMVTSLKPGKIDGIGTAGRHLVTVSKKSDMTQPVARFYFSFREQGSDRLCLWYETFYGTWRLQPQKGNFCRCNASA